MKSLHKLFKDRKDAGKQLAQKLSKYKSNHTLVLALPRGGVPVGYEVALALEAPLDTLVVRKIGAPFQEEFGVGAIAPGDVIVIDNQSLQSIGLEQKDIDPIIEKEMREMERRIMHYRSGEFSRDVLADTVIIVDDGLATGVSARAAIESVLIQQKPLRIIFAVPICARDTANAIGKIVTVTCLRAVDNLVAIGNWYEDFQQVTDEEVVTYLVSAYTQGA